MVDGETGFQGWSATYDREMTEIFALQEELATNVVQALEVKLSPAEKAAIARPAARDPRAYDCYLQGRKYYYGYGPRDMEFAIQLFIKAITLDLDYALAYAGLADCWSFLYLYSNRHSVIREQAQWASSKAVALDPQCAQSHASRALALSLGNSDPAAEAEFEQAKSLDPGLFEAHYFHARHAFVRGEYQKAAGRYEEAMRVRPEDYQAPLLVAQIYEELGRPEQARQARLRGIDRAKEHLEMNPDDARAVYMAANGMVALGQKEQGVDWARRAQQMSPDDSMLLYNVGCIYAMAGAGEEAMDCLERACEKGLTQKGWYEHDSNLDSLRGQPRFAALLRRLDELGAA
jgi:adenylate cyclase